MVSGTENPLLLHLQVMMEPKTKYKHRFNSTSAAEKANLSMGEIPLIGELYAFLKADLLFPAKLMEL